jgi:hypothetical protein
MTQALLYQNTLSYNKKRKKANKDETLQVVLNLVKRKTDGIPK